MTLPEVATHLAGAGLGLTVAANLFYGPVPDRSTTAPAVGLLPYAGGRPSEQRMGAADLAYEWPRVQVLVRGAVDGLEAALLMAQGVYTTLGKISAQTLSGTFYHRVTCLQPPYLLRYDEHRRPIIVFNCEIEKVVSA